jgi:hypothetical protein
LVIEPHKEDQETKDGRGGGTVRALGMGSHRRPDPNLTLVDHSHEDNKHGLLFINLKTLFLSPNINI